MANFIPFPESWCCISITEEIELVTCHKLHCLQGSGIRFHRDQLVLSA
uniref:Uncharacterized protein n=1 Tax=Arundo donax TaxID=35708 RepID=A0A0A9DQ60_ARUDO